VRTAENPGDTAVRQLHPLTRNIMEAPKAKGGLGMVKTLLSYCKLTLTLTLPLGLGMVKTLLSYCKLTLTLPLGLGMVKTLTLTLTLPLTLDLALALTLPLTLTLTLGEDLA